MNKLQELSLRLHAVSVMRDLLEDKVIKALMNFLDLTDEASEADKVDAYTLFVSELYKTGAEDLSCYVKKIVFEIIQVVIAYVIATIYGYYNTPEPDNKYSWLISAIMVIIIYPIIKLARNKIK